MNKAAIHLEFDALRLRLRPQARSGPPLCTAAPLGAPASRRPPSRLQGCRPSQAGSRVLEAVVA